MSRSTSTVEIPTNLHDKENGKRYTRGKFLGKGGFAKCYEFKTEGSAEVLAGKIVPKSLLVKSHQKEKMAQEIKLHRRLKHKYVVEFVSSFQDDHFVYITLEMCAKKSMMELHKRRGAITEPEVRYYMQQICEGIAYLHNEKNIIHRDLKLGNIFLDDKLHIKIGDFGLATEITRENERKKTLCGTPNYIAPEILTKKGHGFEVDIWSTGCIMYTLLVGKPPFETNSLKETYSRIKKNEYVIPEDRVGNAASDLIVNILQGNPDRRPKVNQILNHDFIKIGYIPRHLPVSALTMQPKLTEQQMSFSTTRQPNPYKNEFKENVGEENFVRPIFRKSLAPNDIRRPTARPECLPEAKLNDLVGLEKLVAGVLRRVPEDGANASRLPDEAEHPASSPIYWVSKWVDYSDKYGIGYTLSDNSVGVLYNDSTRIVLHQNGEQLTYLNKEYQEQVCKKTEYPPELKKKVSLIEYFRKYMTEHLLKAGAAAAPREGDELARLPHLRTWFRTRSAICLWLSNGTMQINWFESHDKLVFCPKMEAITQLKPDGNTRTFKASLLNTGDGITRDMADKLKYAKSMIKKLKDQNAQAGRNTATNRE